MSEHHGSSSPEETSSEHESASDTSFDDCEPSLTAYRRKASWTRPRPADDAPLFPVSLLSACSAQGRAAMCQYARSIAAQEAGSSKGGRTGPPSHERPASSSNGIGEPAPRDSRAPALSHRMKHDKSILALAVSSQYIFAGTQGGEILVWCTAGFGHLYALWSPYDIGDIFCVAYSSLHRTVYLGAQNTSIQWYDLKEKDARPRPALASHPSQRKNRFFDSLGPGGAQTPKPFGADAKPRDAVGGQELQIDSQDIYQFAHFGYVHCMLLGKGMLPGAPDEEVLVSGGGDGRILLWRIDPTRGGLISTICALEDGREEGESILSLAREGSFLYSGRFDGEVNVWDLETRQLVRSLKSQTGDVHTLTLGAGVLFAGGKSGVVHKFNEHYETMSTFKAHNGLILASAYTMYNDKPTLVTGGNDNTIVIWEVRDCAEPAAAARRSNNGAYISVPTGRANADRPHGRVAQPVCQLPDRLVAAQNFGAVTEMINTSEPYNPIVFAKFRGNPATAAARKKILFYGHYDVIPAENEHGKWKHDPFTLTGEGGYLYGRGVSDNKGPIMAAIYAAHELANEQSLDADIIFLIEGEEESGSRGFEEAVQARKNLIGDVDWILLANSYWLDDHVPCITYGLRGVIHATVQVESEHPDLHSGVDGSALLDEPLKDLVMLLSKLTGRHGKVQIPGFYDPILPLADGEKELYTEITQTLLRNNPDLGDPEELAQSLMRRWREASLTIHRFQTSGPENSTIIPRLAKAALSIRLVPNQSASHQKLPHRHHRPPGRALAGRLHQ
ncbi:hypothetical protein OPT61_g10003 [Boeremia exigua]|uniref:Uncharacterized protein n=1 Tax=Boeremia exigua TaxID=749465 RepID=A0ACC2HRN9_9PLEO|nr:hypothetical protein OPT61_g10003 [Boeremia exigua]